MSTATPLWTATPHAGFFINSVAISASGQRIVAGTFFHDYGSSAAALSPGAEAKLAPRMHAAAGRAADAAAAPSQYGRFGTYVWDRGGTRLLAAEFEAAFSIQPFPAFLYNAALAYENGGELGRAAEFYVRFVGAETGPRPAKLRLTPDMTGGAVLAAILDNVADGLLLHLPNVVWLRNPVAIHQARVALRRLRAALPLFGVRVDTPERAEAMRQTAGDIARRLGTVRDLDVFCSETLSRAEAEFPTEAGWANLKTVAEARRVAEAQVLTETVTAWDTTNFLLDLLHWRDEAGAQLPSGSGAGEVARTLLADRWRRVNRQGSRMDRIDVPGLHELRIKIKKLRYLVDFTKSLFDPNATSTWESRLSPLQDALGTLNDGASARSLIRGMMPILDKEGAFAAGLLIAWADGRTLRHRNRIQQLWDDLADLPPYWKD
jgi:CHAD domain-containing protein